MIAGPLAPGAVCWRSYMLVFLTFHLAPSQLTCPLSYLPCLVSFVYHFLLALLLPTTYQPHQSTTPLKSASCTLASQNGDPNFTPEPLISHRHHLLCQVHIMDQPELAKGAGPIGLVLAPTRELAEQIHREMRKFAKPYGGCCIAVVSIR